MVVGCRGRSQICIFYFSFSCTHTHTNTRRQTVGFYRFLGGQEEEEAALHSFLPAPVTTSQNTSPKNYLRSIYVFLRSKPTSADQNRTRQEKLRPPLPVCRHRCPSCSSAHHAPCWGRDVLSRVPVLCVDVSAAAGLEEGLFLAPEEERRISRRGGRTEERLSCSVSM